MINFFIYPSISRGQRQARWRSFSCSKDIKERLDAARWEVSTTVIKRKVTIWLTSRPGQTRARWEVSTRARTRKVIIWPASRPGPYAGQMGRFYYSKKEKRKVTIWPASRAGPDAGQMGSFYYNKNEKSHNLATKSHIWRAFFCLQTWHDWARWRELVLLIPKLPSLLNLSQKWPVQTRKEDFPSFGADELLGGNFFGGN
jgi:hypothetical protein